VDGIKVDFTRRRRFCICGVVKKKIEASAEHDLCMAGIIRPESGGPVKSFERVREDDQPCSICPCPDFFAARSSFLRSTISLRLSALKADSLKTQ
jgi:hypothetical protein